MKLRHAAALALTGWYLMIAPTHHDRQTHEWITDLTAPISEWSLTGSFDAANDCKKEIDRRQQWTDKYAAGNGKNADMLEAEISGAACIATDDPRLKGK